MEKEIYVVTSGEYSDYHIEGVFSTLETAIKYKDTFGGEEIEIYELDRCFNGNRNLYEVIMDIDTFNVERIDVVDEGYYRKEGIFRIQMELNRNIILYISSDKFDAVSKIASEKLMQIKALKDIKFPYMEEKVISYISPYNKMVLFHKYPTYDFKTGHILLFENEQLKDGVKATTKIIER